MCALIGLPWFILIRRVPGLTLTRALPLLWLAGFAMASMGYQWARFVVRPSLPIVMAMDVFMAGSLALVALGLRRGKSPLLPRSLPRFGALEMLIVGAMVSVLALKLVTVARQARGYPIGEWDAWAIWNLHAKFLFWGDGDSFRSLFSSNLAWSHNDYPLLLPAGVARVWTYLGETPVVPSVLSWMTLLCVIGLLIGAPIHRLRQGGGMSGLAHRLAGWVSAILLCSRQAFVQQGAWQYADLLVAAYVLAAWVSFWMSDEAADTLCLSGFLAGSAALVKNEGIAYFAIFAALLVWQKKQPRQWLLWVVGATLPMLTLLYFKVALAPHNDLMAAPVSWSRSFAAERLAVVLNGFVSQIGAELLALLVLLGAGYRFRLDWGGPAIRFALFLFGAMVGVQVLVYLHTPYDLDWHLATSLHRLCAQSWPVLTVVLVALSLDLLEHIFSRSSANIES